MTFDELVKTKGNYLALQQLEHRIYGDSALRIVFQMAEDETTLSFTLPPIP
ncbi:hypothetical protein [Peribacillus kribbensis]|uniref:hypothetical protein n=1 Tax=Peribacillus kribbensis TaxID=356658 RepID=UPI000415D7B0|nr:hypothetical protein [Peribacillus kribbensis]